MVEFTEKEQEEIINKFLDDLNKNETEKILKHELSKHNYNSSLLLYLKLPFNAIRLIKEYGERKCKCDNCIHLNQTIDHANRYFSDVSTIYYFNELYKFPKEEELKLQFNLAPSRFKKYRSGFNSRLHDPTRLKHFVPSSQLKEFNDILKYIHEHNFTKYEHIKLSYYPEINL